MPVRKSSQPHASQGFPPPYWSVPGALLYLGDVRACLRLLPARSVHCVVTSPPYWGLRDYGTGEWEGGNVECDHKPTQEWIDHNFNKCSSFGTGAKTQSAAAIGRWYKSDKSCPRCGAKRIDMQIGAEPSPDCDTHGQAQCGSCFVCSLVSVMRDVHRVLRDDGMVWLNLGDTYGGSGSGGHGANSPLEQGKRLRVGHEGGGFGHGVDTHLPPGNLVGIPWRVALALQADGWLLRQDIIWYSPNKMPESVTTRCSKSHEHIFLLAKGDGYYFDHVAIQEPAKSTWKDSDFLPDSDKDKSDATGTAATRASRSNREDITRGKRRGGGSSFGKSRHPVDAAAAGAPVRDYNGGDPCTVNKRDTWIVATTGYPGAHFATFSPQLITPCILAGSSEHGCCASCNRPYERVVTRIGAVKTDGEVAGKEDSRDRSFDWSRNGTDSTLDSGIAQYETIGWRKTCGCSTNDVVPATILDPFVGSGTTVATALQLGRAGVGIDLSEKYLCANAIPRIVAAVESIPGRATMVLPQGTAPPPRKLRGH